MTLRKKETGLSLPLGDGHCRHLLPFGAGLGALFLPTLPYLVSSTVPWLVARPSGS